MDSSMNPAIQGINIFSGEIGLGAALTNPTELAKSKGKLNKSYPVVFENKKYPDAETAYLLLKTEDAQANDHMMVCVIAQKFIQHPTLFEEVVQRGGLQFLEQCSHFTYAKSESAKSWEGAGKESRFIRNLITAFEHVASKDIPNRTGQDSLF